MGGRYYQIVCVINNNVVSAMNERHQERILVGKGIGFRARKGDLVDKTTVKGLAFQEPMLEFNGACAGCGEMTIVKMLTQLFGDRISFADAMGCTMVSLGGTGVVP